MLYRSYAKILMTLALFRCCCTTISISEGILRAKIEELELKLFWKTYTKEFLKELMTFTNQKKLDPSCRCLSCRIAGRISDDYDGPPTTHHHQYGHCVFKAYFEDLLDQNGLIFGRENDEGSDELHFILEGRGDWVFWRWGRRLESTKSVKEPDLTKLRSLFNAMSGIGGPEITDHGISELANIVRTDPLDDTCEHLQQVVNLLKNDTSMSERFRASILAHVESSMQSIQLVAQNMEQRRAEDLQRESVTARLESQVSVLTQDREALLAQLHDIVSDRRPELICPISRDVFRDPVLLVGSGHTYERSDLVRWLRAHSTDPVTNAELISKEFVPNFLVKALLEPQGFLSKRVSDDRDHEPHREPQSPS